MTEEKASVPHVYAAINEVQHALAVIGIAKDRTNPQQGYKFRGIDDVYNAVCPLIAKAHLCIMPRMLSRTMTERPSQKGGVLFSVVVEAEYDFVSAVDGSKHVVRMYGEAMDSGDKATNKAMSAAYKYAVMQAFSIPTEGDNEADGRTQDPASTTPSQALRGNSAAVVPPVQSTAPVSPEPQAHSLSEADGKLIAAWLAAIEGSGTEKELDALGPKITAAEELNERPDALLVLKQRWTARRRQIRGK